MRALKTSILALALGMANATNAQSPGVIDLRVSKLEKEVRAVQRVVFPQGTPVQPDLSANVNPATPSGTAASAPLADLNARVDALERQVSVLTGTSEQNAYRLKQMDTMLSGLQARVGALEKGPATTAEPVDSSTVGDTRTPLPAARRDRETPGPAAAKPKPARADPPVVAAKADAGRKAMVAAVERPDTGDGAEDDYTYGFRLYTAKFYPEAVTQLKEFTSKYPPLSRRWSYAQNLLGRAYYDDGKPALASVAFYDNYQKAPQGERVVDSLTWLGQALVRLKKPADACKVYRVLAEDYSGKLNTEQRARAAKGRADAKCST